MAGKSNIHISKYNERMTYGEALVEAKENMTFNSGVLSLKMPECKKRMSYKEMCEYYNDKLFKYWISRLDSNMPYKMKRKVLMYLLGRV